MRIKRIEYDKGYFITDKNLEQTISDEACRFVDEIVDGVGKDYIMPDLQGLIMSIVQEKLIRRLLQEGYENMVEAAKEKTKNENNPRNSGTD